MLKLVEWFEIYDTEDLEDVKAGNCFYLKDTLTDEVVYKVYLDNDACTALCVANKDDKECREFVADICLAFGYFPKEVLQDG